MFFKKIIFRVFKIFQSSCSFSHSTESLAYSFIHSLSIFIGIKFETSVSLH